MAERLSPLSTVGDEVVRIIAPVSACMLLVVVLVSSLPSTFPFSSPSSSSSSPSFWDDLVPALVSSLGFVVVVTLATFLLLLLFYFRCTPFLKSYIAFSSFLVPLLLGGQVALSIASAFSLPLDAPTFAFLLLNLSVLAAVSVSAPVPIAVTQSALVAISGLVAYWFTALPEWTTWALLIAMALYDLAAVLLPVGPLRLLVELAISRDEDIPALVYEARPVERLSEEVPPGMSRVGPVLSAEPSSHSTLQDSLLRDGQIHVAEEESHSNGEEGIGFAATGAIKLGLGDFIFYSVLVGRAAMYDYLTVYSCYLAIVAGLGITLLLLAFYRKALPALPISISLGVLFYFITRLLLEAFVMQCSVNLLMF